MNDLHSLLKVSEFKLVTLRDEAVVAAYLDFVLELISYSQE